MTEEKEVKQNDREKRLAFSRIWQETERVFTMSAGSLLAALGYSLFQVPHNIAAGGLGGVCIIVNYFTGWPVGVMYLLLNIPLLALGYFYLGRWRFVIHTVLSVVVFSVSTDLFTAYLPLFIPNYPLTANVLLSAIYGGIVGGLGGGLVYRAGSTIGGTGIIGRIIQQKTSTPLSQIYLYTDGLIIVVAGMIFGWEIALYAMLTLFLGGMASDYVLEGPSVVRTITVITNYPQEVAQAFIRGLGRGVSHWEITGSYTGEKHGMLMCTVYRSQVNDVRRIVAEIDPAAFVVIGEAHQALGFGFTPLDY